jgi:hypothetical protein
LVTVWQKDTSPASGSGWWRLFTATSPPFIKRYFAGGQQIAMRHGDALYYTLPDPAGTSMLIVDSKGITTGHVLYDPYGGVLESDLSVELVEALAGTGSLEDPVAGLVHLGQGRWYDPGLGRPLQPDPVGGPPSVPQAVNRYAATSVGQPGVAEAIVNEANLIAVATRDTILQTAVGYGAGKAIETTASWGSLSITTSQYGWRKLGDLRSLFQRGAKNLELGKTFRTYNSLGRVRDLGKGRYLAETGEFIETAGLPASARVRFMPRFGPLIRNFVGGSAAFGISAVFQGIEDYFFEPSLTPGQRTGRIVVSGFGGLGAWVAGGIAAKIAFGAGAGSWAGPIGIGVGATVTFVWIVWIQPAIFEARGLNSPERNLAPLQN